MKDHPVIEELIDLLKKHGASIDCSCRTGCDLEIFAKGKKVASFCCSINRYGNERN